jgi:MFS superfamily sulfate permease-like transporter
MKILRKLAGLFLADTLVMVAVPAVAIFGWLAAPVLPRPLVAVVLLALLAGSFSLGVLRAARSLTGSAPSD